MSNKTDRQKAFKRGVWAERIAALYLMAKGYRIVARREQTPVGEIDLIARRGKTLAFIEVKARSTRTEAAHALGVNQRHRIERAAVAWSAHRPWTAAMTLRFDVVWMGRGKLPQHIPNAWHLEL